MSISCPSSACASRSVRSKLRMARARRSSISLCAMSASLCASSWVTRLPRLPCLKCVATSCTENSDSWYFLKASRRMISEVVK